MLVKDESHNPTGTFKDLLARAVVELAEPGTTVAAYSYGNTALSLAHVAAHDAWRERGLSLAIFVPADLAEWRLGPSSRGQLVDGTTLYQQIAKHARVVAVPRGSGYLRDREMADALDVPVTRLLNVSEGLPVPTYAVIAEEVVEQLGAAPDVWLVPFGAGILCHEVRRVAEPHGGAVVALTTLEQGSMARMLYGPHWLRYPTRDGGRPWSLQAPDRPSYPVTPVSEQEICLGLLRAHQLGLSCEPSAAVGLGVLDRLAELVPSADRRHTSIVVISTGNGLDLLAQPTGAPR